MMSLARPFTRLCLTAGVFAVLATAAGAQDGHRRQRPQQVPPSGAEDSAQQLAPESDEGARTLDAITSRSIEGLVFEKRADGTVGLDLQGRFMQVLTAAPDGSGHVGVVCRTGSGAAATATAVAPWRPVRGQMLRRVVVPSLAAALAAPEKPVVLEEK
jgi:hypothetical protein